MFDQVPVDFVSLCFFSDGDMEWEEEMEYPTYSHPVEDDASDFDFLLQQAQQKLRHKQ